MAAFASAITYRGVSGSQRITRGTFASSAGATGGDINTGLISCRSITLQPKAAAVGTDQPVVNETLPVAGNAVTIVTIADQVGTWEAEGY